MDSNFILRHDRKLTVFLQAQLRRDPNFKYQLYFYSCLPMGANKFGLYFSQAVAASTDPLDQSVHAVDFLKRQRTSEIQDPDVSFAIDERAAKFYLGFCQNPNVCPKFLLKIFDIDFDPVDHLGYRRIHIRGGDRFYIIVPEPVSLFICPVTGKLFGYYPMLGVSGKQYCGWAAIEQPHLNNTVLRSKFSDFKFNVENESRRLCPYALTFSKLDHLVVFYAFSAGFEKLQSQKLVFICSYDTKELNLVRCLAFNPFDFVSQFLPRAVLTAFCQSRPSWASESEVVGQRMNMIVGRIHKYMLFQFQSYILAVKWPKNWYMGEHLPPVQLSRVFDLEDFMDSQQIYEMNEMPVTPISLSNDHFFYLLFHPRDKPNEVKRLCLSPRFKDYRQCANCGEIEKRKRRNKEGKRVAKFKVCRLCKKKNFHLFYLDPEIACHYCSDECQKKHWKIHKAVHKRNKMDRKTASAKTVEEKF